MHRPPGLDAGDDISCNAIMVSRGIASFRVAAREVEKVNACKDNKKAGEERKDVDRVRGVETAVKDKRGAEGCCGKSYIVQRIDAG